MLIDINYILNDTNIQISKTVYDDVLNEQIGNAEFVDVQTLMGSDFYNDLVRNYQSVDYQALLNGGDYTYNGTTYTNVGLKIVIAYYTKARYSKFGSFIDDPFGGLSEKKNEYSDRATSKDKQIIYTQNRDIAFKYWRNVEDFINRNLDKYPLWKTEDCTTTTNRFRISKIS